MTRSLYLYCLNCRKFVDMSKSEEGNFKCQVCGKVRIYKSKKGEFTEVK